MTTLLNFAIGMVAVFLFVSLFVSIIQELIAQVLAMRAHYLRLGIVKLLEQGKADLGVLGARSLSSKTINDFFGNPLIQALSSRRIGRTSDPSYVSKDTFVSVAFQIMNLAGNGLRAAPTYRAHSNSYAPCDPTAEPTDPRRH